MEEYLKGHEASGIKVGDKVKVTRAADDWENGWNNTWITSEMDECVGETWEVIADNAKTGFQLEAPGYYEYPYFVLEVV